MELVSVSVPRHQQEPQPGDTRGCALPDTHSAPAALTDPPQSMAGPISHDSGASMNMYSRAEKAAGKEKREENKRSGKLHRKHQGERHGREVRGQRK